MSRAQAENINQLADEIYREFLLKAKMIEKDRDQRIAALFEDNDAQRVSQILKDIKDRADHS